MHIAIQVSNQLMAEAIYQLFVTNGYDAVMSGRSLTKGFTPDVLLVDITTLRHDLLAQYQNAKVLLIDTGIEEEKLIATLLSYRIHGVLSPHTDLPLFKKALAAISKGKLWIDNGTVKALLHDAGSISQRGKISHITSREQEIIEGVCQGLSNKEIAQRLSVSPHTVKADLNRIFKKFNVTNRSKLMLLAMHRPRGVSV